MTIILTKKATPEQLKKMGYEYGNYIIRSSQENPSRDVLSVDIRKQFDEIVKSLLL